MKSKRCAVIKCNNDGHSHNISFHGLPSDPLESHEWHEFLDLANEDFKWTKTCQMLICSDHFDKSCFGPTEKRLLKHSVPTKVQGKAMSNKNLEVDDNLCCENGNQEIMLHLITPTEWSDKVAEYASALGNCENEILVLKARIRDLEEAGEQKNKKIHVLSQRTRRQEKRKSEQNRFENFKRQKIMHKKDTFTQTHFLTIEAITPAEALLEEISNRLIEPHGPYSDILKNFAFEMHFKSPSAYNLLREKLDKALPHSINFNRWTKHIDCDPGFLEASFEYLRKAVEDSSYTLFGAMMFDEVYMRKSVLHDGEGFTGFVDYGELGEPVDPDEVATKAIFFNLTEINWNKKIPLAYALTNKLPKQTLRQMLERVLIRLQLIGVRVLTLTCDGLSTNLAALESMGANLKPMSPSFQPWIPHPLNRERVYIILDACHMYKLVRNVLKAKTNFYVTGISSLGDETETESTTMITEEVREPENEKSTDGTHVYEVDMNEENEAVNLRISDNEVANRSENPLILDGETGTSTHKVISWKYIEKLESLQRESGLRAANKLTTRHTSFESQKMKTKLCLQTLSNSVSVAIGVCRDLNLEGFEESEETQYFLSLMNRLFDALNSRSCGTGRNSPLKQSNYQYWQPLFEEAKAYLLKLLYDEKNDGKLVPLITSRNGTAFKGLFITITSLQLIMTDIIFNPGEDLWYLPTWKFLQDAIELFFSMLRSRFGHNDNPNARQLKCAVRDIMCMKLKDLITGNCIAQEELSSAISPLKNLKKIIYDDDSQDFEDAEEFIISQLELTKDCITFVRAVVVYIAGYSISKLCRSLECSGCICMLLPDEIELAEEYLLIIKRDNGGLCYPSTNVVKICTTVETHVRFWQGKGLKDMKKHKVIESSIRECRQIGLIESPNCHQDKNHGMEVARQIMEIYLKARLHHLARESTARIVPTTNRSSNKKSTHFAGN